MRPALEEHYTRLERRFPMVDGSDYERLVVPQGNADESVHRWFHMKEAYSPLLLSRLLKDLDLTGRPRLRLHDPFAGSGTTLVSALTLGEGPLVTATGSEVNPFLHLLSSTKVAVLSLPEVERRDLAAQVVAAAECLTRSRRGPVPAAPALPAFGDTRYFPPDVLADLLRTRAAWGELAPSLCRDVLAIALAGCVEACSRLRRDGRALRYTPEKRPDPLQKEFAQRIARVAQDLQAAQPRGCGLVRAGSALDVATWPVSDDQSDLLCFSPPYPNNIDYTEVYKLEAWFLGLIQDVNGFVAQRRTTMRSHPSTVFPPRPWLDAPASTQDAVLQAAQQLAAPVVAAIPPDRYRHQRARVIEGYLADAAVVLWRCRQALRVGGHAVCVVGNSRHGSGDEQYTIASDVLLAALGHEVGLGVVEVKVARWLHRRGRHDHLRESLVILRKTAA